MKVKVNVKPKGAAKEWTPNRGDLCMYLGSVCIKTNVPVGTHGALVSLYSGDRSAGTSGPITPFYGTITITSEEDL